MPRTKQRAKRRRTGYERQHIRQLLTGQDFFGNAFGKGDRCDREAMRAAWEELRDKLLADWISEKPGTRPYAWWCFDAPERRRRIDGLPHPFDNLDRKAMIDAVEGEAFAGYREKMTQLYYGAPSSLCDPDDFDAEYESETDYLARLDLLTDFERRLGM